jgi:hypothetical protein
MPITLRPMPLLAKALIPGLAALLAGLAATAAGFATPVLVLVAAAAATIGSALEPRARPAGRSEPPMADVSARRADSAVTSAASHATSGAAPSAAGGDDAESAMLRREISTLRHDLRGILSPPLLLADRICDHADPTVRRAAEAMINAVEKAEQRLRQTPSKVS